MRDLSLEAGVIVSMRFYAFTRICLTATLYANGKDDDGQRDSSSEDDLSASGREYLSNVYIEGNP